MDSRYHALCQWVAQQLNEPQVELSVVSGDASFRRYFRYTRGSESWIAMDAPPEKEDSTRFVAIAQSWFAQGIRVPEIKALNMEHGFMLLSDFGSSLLLAPLNPSSPDVSQGEHYYTKAMQALIQIQSSAHQDLDLPLYDEALLQREMALFKDWLLEAKLGIQLSQQEVESLKQCLVLLQARAEAQVQVVVHRDYHARNLMICADDRLGIIDFQDAVIGPITYDLVSLLRDCYIVWPLEQVHLWCKAFFELISKHQPDYANRIGSAERFQEDFDLMGLQRHLKVAGIFARLSLRDGKHGYLADIPRTLNYIVSVSKGLLEKNAQAFACLAFLVDLIESKVLPEALKPEFIPSTL